MITSPATELRILSLMEKGAKLYLHYSCHGDGYSTLYMVTLDYNDKSLRISDPVEYPPMTEDPINLRSELAERIKARPDIRQGYTYNSEYGKRWREVYEHKSTPTPRWVTEQWSFDEYGALI